MKLPAAPGAPGRAKVAARLAGLSQHPPAGLAQRPPRGQAGCCSAWGVVEGGVGGRQAGRKPLTWGLKNKGHGFLCLGQAPWPGSSLDGRRDVGTPGGLGTSLLWNHWALDKGHWQGGSLRNYFLTSCASDYGPHRGQARPPRVRTG